jgi:hypothetical protein
VRGVQRNNRCNEPNSLKNPTPRFLDVTWSFCHRTEFPC